MLSGLDEEAQDYDTRVYRNLARAAIDQAINDAVKNIENDPDSVCPATLFLLNRPVFKRKGGETPALLPEILAILGIELDWFVPRMAKFLDEVASKSIREQEAKRGVYTEAKPIKASGNKEKAVSTKARKSKNDDTLTLPLALVSRVALARRKAA